LTLITIGVIIMRNMIKSYKDKETEKVYYREYSKKLPRDIQKTAMKKLWMLDAAPDLQSLRVPPGNKLELLSGNREGRYSIRINDQWRICFRWIEGNAHDVEIVDYH
jgi:proteic killer suppression protein